MKKFIKSIDKQIEANQGKNIFADNLGAFQFITESIKAIADVGELDTPSEEVLTDYATDKALEAFCDVNQYYSFDAASKTALRGIYSDLFKAIRLKTGSVQEISKQHYGRLQHWLKVSNPFAAALYTGPEEKVSPVVCSEYSPDLQLEILHLDLNHIMQPVLDIGCGRQGSLVHYFNSRGIEAFGIDRFRFAAPSLITADWLEFDYGVNKWGTVISNLGFSNHFQHHHLRPDGNFIEYGKIYMKILHALKTDGCFHYAPDLPFMERYLDGNQFALNLFEIGEYAFYTTVVKRLK